MSTFLLVVKLYYACMRCGHFVLVHIPFNMFEKLHKDYLCSIVQILSARTITDPRSSFDLFHFPIDEDQAI